MDHVKKVLWLLALAASAAHSQGYPKSPFPPTFPAHTFGCNATGSTAVPTLCTAIDSTLAATINLTAVSQLPANMEGGLNCTGNFSNPVSGGSTTNGCQYGAFTISGTQSGALRYSPFRFNLVDSYDGQNNASGIPDNGFERTYTMSGGTWTGGKALANDQLAITSTNSATDTSAGDLVDNLLTVRDNGFSMHGTPFAPFGQLWAIDTNMIMQTGSDNLQLVIGIESDNNLQAGTVRNHQGILSVTSNGTGIRGQQTDAAYVVGNSNDPTGNAFGWRTGLQFGNSLGYSLNTDSTLILAQQRTNTSALFWSLFDYGIDFRAGTPTSGFTAYHNAGTDLNGNTYAGNLTTGAALTAQTATVASIAPAVGLGGFTGGVYYASNALPICTITAPPNSGTNATCTVATMRLNAISLLTGGTGCTTSDVLTLTGDTGTEPTITVTVVSGSVTSAVITSAGSLTAKAANPGTTGGTCSVQPTFKFGYGIATVTVTNAGTGYLAYPLPLVVLSGAGAQGTSNITASLIPTMSATTVPVTITGGIKGTVAADSAPVGAVGELLGVKCTAGLTGTITVNATTDIVTWTGHTFASIGSPAKWSCSINFSTSTTLPAGLVAGTNYWVDGATLSGDTFQISDTLAHALAGTNHVDMTDTGTGTQTGWIGGFMTNSNAMAVAGLGVTAGDWDCNAVGEFVPVTNVTFTREAAGINSTASTTLTIDQSAMQFTASNAITTNNLYITTPTIQQNFSSTTNISLAENMNFSLGTINGGGVLRCRRMR